MTIRTYKLFDITAGQMKFVAVLSGITLIAAGALLVRSYSTDWTGTTQTGTTQTSDAKAIAYEGSFTIDLNLSPVDSLELVPGIGVVLAGRIDDARLARPFDSVGDVTRVRGIGPATLEKIRPYLKVGGR